MFSPLWRPLARRMFLGGAYNFHSSVRVTRHLPSRILFTSAVVIGVFTPIAYNAFVHLDTDRNLNESITLPTPDKQTRPDPDTGIEFPTLLTVPSKVRLPTFTLIGVGVRKVSFLRVKVYSIGFYADLSSPAISKMPSDLSPEDKIHYLVSNTACVLRIIPTRTTTHGHLRDGFLRALHARIRQSNQDGKLSETEQLQIGAALRKFGTLFPNTPLQKHSPLEILLTAPEVDPNEQRALVVRDLGAVQNNWLAREFFLAYFEGQGISPPLKERVIQRLQTLGSLKA
ncbi:hypothetical protein BD410DRAFT_834821 [Rickenella mellea]|uniref:Chalcone isomerase domain-containing protein n=1 Tax=Rickenella mellea TaxID=50990 RepID=A0A4Y7QPB2_9AGAM|nr:hypothetical protein BD410DRAFT_834821 [Rickenella mellea]